MILLKKCHGRVCSSQIVCIYVCMYVQGQKDATERHLYLGALITKVLITRI
jgi:hypothetical protein